MSAKFTTGVREAYRGNITARWLVHFKTAGIIEVGGSSAKYRNQQGNQEPPSPPSPPTPSTMVRRQISIELKEAALSMSLNGMPDAEIRQVTGISERSLKRLRSLYRKTGGVVPPPPLDPGRPRTLTAIHVKVRYDTQRLRSLGFPSHAYH